MKITVNGPVLLDRYCLQGPNCWEEFSKCCLKLLLGVRKTFLLNYNQINQLETSVDGPFSYQIFLLLLTVVSNDGDWRTASALLHPSKEFFHHLGNFYHVVFARYWVKLSLFFFTLDNVANRSIILIMLFLYYWIFNKNDNWLCEIYNYIIANILI